MLRTKPQDTQSRFRATISCKQAAAMLSGLRYDAGLAPRVSIGPSDIGLMANMGFFEKEIESGSPRIFLDHFTYFCQQLIEAEQKTKAWLASLSAQGQAASNTATPTP